MQFGIPNHYDTLAVPEYASATAIKEAYQNQYRRLKTLLKESSTVFGIEAEIGELTEAYETLSDPITRPFYDCQIQNTRSSFTEKSGWTTFDGFAIRPVNELSPSEQKYHQGLAFLQADQPERALPCFHKLLKFEQNNPLLLELVGRAYSMTGATTFAVRTMTHAIKIDPDNHRLYFLLGKFFEADKQLGQARKFYKKAYYMNPTDPQAREQYFRGSLVLESVGSVIFRGVRCFLPARNMRTFRLEDGLITRDMLRLFKHWLIHLPKPKPASFSFRYTGLW